MSEATREKLWTIQFTKPLGHDFIPQGEIQPIKTRMGEVVGVCGFGDSSPNGVSLRESSDSTFFVPFQSIFSARSRWVKRYEMKREIGMEAAMFPVGVEGGDGNGNAE